MDRILKSTKAEKRVRNGYIIAFILLLMSFLIALYINNRLVKQARMVEHTYIVINKLEVLLSKVKDAESGVRGYALTRNIEWLYPYYGSEQAVDSIFKELQVLSSDNTTQYSRLLDLKKLTDRRFEIWKFGLKDFEANNRQITDTMANLRPETKKLMEHIRRSVAYMQYEEKKLLDHRNESFRKSISALHTVTIVSPVIACLLVIFGFVTYRIERRKKRNAIQDISQYQNQLKNRIEQLDKANAELIKMRSLEKFTVTGRIARTIAHEVRNPLTNINLAADQLKTEVIQPDENSTLLFEMIERNSGRINQLISDLLNSTKFSELTFEKISVKRLLDEALKDAGDRVTLSNVKIIKQYSSNACEVLVDKGRIRVAFLNIIVNALEAMGHKKNGRLTLETKEADGKCKIIISDNGSGMDRESLNRVFEAYFTNKEKGNGLGLTNTQNILLNHKGEITVESEPGEGTAFTITLNLAH